MDRIGLGHLDQGSELEEPDFSGWIMFPEDARFLRDELEILNSHLQMGPAATDVADTIDQMEEMRAAAAMATVSADIETAKLEALYESLRRIREAKRPDDAFSAFIGDGALEDVFRYNQDLPARLEALLDRLVELAEIDPSLQEDDDIRGISESAASVALKYLGRISRYCEGDNSLQTKINEAKHKIIAASEIFEAIKRKLEASARVDDARKILEEAGNTAFKDRFLCEYLIHLRSLLGDLLERYEAFIDEHEYSDNRTDSITSEIDKIVQDLRCLPATEGWDENPDAQRIRDQIEVIIARNIRSLLDLVWDLLITRQAIHHQYIPPGSEHLKRIYLAAAQRLSKITLDYRSLMGLYIALEDSTLSEVRRYVLRDLIRKAIDEVRGFAEQLDGTRIKQRDEEILTLTLPGRYLTVKVNRSSYERYVQHRYRGKRGKLNLTWEMMSPEPGTLRYFFSATNETFADLERNLQKIEYALATSFR